MRRWLTGRRGDMVEGALTFPLMALVTLALVNLALAGFSATTANHAAGYGARRRLGGPGRSRRPGAGGCAAGAAKRHRRLRRPRGGRHLSRRRRARGGGLGGAQLLRQPDAALRRVQRPAQGHGRQRLPQGGLVMASADWLRLQGSGVGPEISGSAQTLSL